MHVYPVAILPQDIGLEPSSIFPAYRTSPGNESSSLICQSVDSASELRLLRSLERLSTRGCKQKEWRATGSLPVMGDISKGDMKAHVPRGEVTAHNARKPRGHRRGGQGGKGRHGQTTGRESVVLSRHQPVRRAVVRLSSPRETAKALPGVVTASFQEETPEGVKSCP